ncbi:MAG: hypothetical protein PHS13_07625 [Firmicutes bacterium]|nr:hypothetical protein [Bacillota bacterium]
MGCKKGLKKLLLNQYRRYPRMECQDMVKLIYQNEFAGGHLISNERDSLKGLEEECRTLIRHSRDIERPADLIFEDIGNGLCRLHLEALEHTSIDLATINKFFVSTANSACGSIRSLEAKLEVFRQCCREGLLPYAADRVEAYLRGYRSRNYPPVSHSKVYRGLYLPAYRIVRTEYRDYFDVFNRIDNLLALKDMDHFFLTPELKTKERLKELNIRQQSDLVFDSISHTTHKPLDI